MSRYFHIGQDRAQWISAAFMAATTLSLLLTPWLLQRYGLRKTYVGANLLLMAGGIVGGLSGNYPVMIAMRVLEGVAAGILTPIPNVVIMREFQIVYANQALAELFGIDLDRFVGSHVNETLRFVHPDDRQRTRDRRRAFVNLTPKAQTVLEQLIDEVIQKTGNMPIG